VIYQLECAGCPETYVGETARSFNTRLKEHLKVKGSLTAVGEHIKSTGHKLAAEKSKVLVREDQFWPRKIREAIQIHIRKPGLNRDSGYHLPPSTNHYSQMTSDRGHLTGRLCFHNTEDGRVKWPKALFKLQFSIPKGRFIQY
jgi:hypothetical protein